MYSRTNVSKSMHLSKLYKSLFSIQEWLQVLMVPNHELLRQAKNKINKILAFILCTHLNRPIMFVSCKFLRYYNYISRSTIIPAQSNAVPERKRFRGLINKADGFYPYLSQMIQNVSSAAVLQLRCFQTLLRREPIQHNDMFLLFSCCLTND